jgi:hypothetical protein
MLYIIAGSVYIIHGYRYHDKTVAMQTIATVIPVTRRMPLVTFFIIVAIMK